MREVTSVSDCNGKTIYVDDTVDLFGMIGTVNFCCGAYGIGFEKEIDWDLIESKIVEVTGCDNRPWFCCNDNFISFWELLWNFNCEDDWCTVVKVIKSTEKERSFDESQRI